MSTFMPWRYIQRFPGFNIIEGLFTRPSPSFPHILVSITTLLFQTPNTSPLFVFTSLPVLIDTTYRRRPRWPDLMRRAGYILFALFTNSIFSSWNLLENHGEVLLGQGAFSGAVALATLAPILLHRALTSKRIVRKEGWEVGIAFGLLWAVGWALFEHVSPFGRYGIPSLAIASPPIALVHRWLGIAGVDILLGLTAYTAYQTGTFLLPAAQYQMEDIKSSMSGRSGRFSFVSGTDTPISALATPPWGGEAVSETSSLLPSPGNSRRTDSTPRPRSSGVAGLATAAMWAGLYTLTSEGDFQHLSASLHEQTPFGVGFVLPPTPKGHSSPTIDTIIHEAQTIGNRANLLVFPETVLIAKTDFERYDAIDRMIEEVCKQYGVWVQLGIDSYQGAWSEEAGIRVKREGRINQVVLVSPDGEVGSYSKQKLIPYVESYPFHPGLMKVPTWELDLYAPPGVNKTDWTSSIPHIRTVRISPAICLDSFHPSLFGGLEPPPDLITISASAPTLQLGKHILARAESLALQHSTPTVLVSSGRKGAKDGNGISALFDGWGRPLHLQRAGRSSVVQIAVPYGEGKERRRSGAEWLGTSGILGAGVVLLVGASAASRNMGKRATVTTITRPDDNSVLIPPTGSVYSLDSFLDTAHTSPVDLNATGSTAGPAHDDPSQQRRGQNSPGPGNGYGTVSQTSSATGSARPLLSHPLGSPETPTPLGRGTRGRRFG